MRFRIKRRSQDNEIVSDTNPHTIIALQRDRTIWRVGEMHMGRRIISIRFQDVRGLTIDEIKREWRGNCTPLAFVRYWAQFHDPEAVDRDYILDYFERYVDRPDFNYHSWVIETESINQKLANRRKVEQC